MKMTKDGKRCSLVTGVSLRPASPRTHALKAQWRLWYDYGITMFIPIARSVFMRRVATKVAVSIPDDLYHAVERTRKKSGKSRSAVVQDALRVWLRREHEAVLVREYEAAYRRRPESRREVKAAEATAVRLLAGTEW